MKKHKFSSETKLKAVLKLIKGEMNITETAREIGCHPTLLGQWKEKFLSEAPKIFETPKETSEKEKKIEELERVVGKFAVQNEFLKKVSASFG
jgi:transposase